MDGFDDDFPYVPAFQAVDLETDQDMVVTLGKTSKLNFHSGLLLYCFITHLDFYKYA